MSRICAALSDQGKRCHRPGIRKVQFFGENELYWNGPWPGWVSVWLCVKHSGPKPRPVRREP